MALPMDEGGKESISPTFCVQHFYTKVSHAAFLYLHLRLVLFWRKNIGAKVDQKMLVKLTQERFTIFRLHKIDEQTFVPSNKQTNSLSFFQLSSDPCKCFVLG
jgi:hypothetical protein